MYKRKPIKSRMGTSEVYSSAVNFWTLSIGMIVHIDPGRAKDSFSEINYAKYTGYTLPSQDFELQ